MAFDLTKELIKGQLTQVNELDSKGNFINGAAISLVSIGLILQGVILSWHNQSYCSPYIPAFVHILPAFLKRLMPFIPLLFTAYKAISISNHSCRLDDYDEIPADPQILYSYLKEPVSVTKIDIYVQMIDVHKENQKKINNKGQKLRRAQKWLDYEVSALVVLLLYQSVC